MNCSVTVVKCTDSAENTNNAVANNKTEDLEWVDRNWDMYRGNKVQVSHIIGEGGNLRKNRSILFVMLMYIIPLTYNGIY